MKNYSLSVHAHSQMARRGIEIDVLRKVMESPEQIQLLPAARAIYQSRYIFGDRMYLVRVVVEFEEIGAVVVTVYRTRSVAKYWRKP